MIELKNIVKKYNEGKPNEVEALRGLSLHIGAGEMVAVMGPSGSGKSTLLNITGAIETPDSGKITIHGETIGEMNDKNLTLYRRKHLGNIFQMNNLIPNLTVRENIEVGACLSD